MITCPVCGVEIKRQRGYYYSGYEKNDWYMRRYGWDRKRLMFCSSGCRTDYYREINEQNSKPSYGDRLNFGFSLIGD